MKKLHKDQLKELKKKRFDFKPQVIELDYKSVKPIESEEEYWVKHAYYKKEIRKLNNNIHKMLYHPDEVLKKFENLLNEMLLYQIVPIEWANEKRMKMYNALNYPSTFRNWVIKKLSRQGKI